MYNTYINLTGHDYFVLPQKNWYNVTFPARATCASFPIPVIDDQLSETNETIKITIMKKSVPFFAKVGDPYESEILILDDDGE